MPAKSRFTRLDAFTKTVDEARIRTSSGGIITIVSLFVVLWLAWGEWTDYRRIEVHPELVVDKGRGRFYLTREHSLRTREWKTNVGNIQARGWKYILTLRSPKCHASF